MLRLFRVGIQSKLLVTLLLCSIMSVAVVGLTGYVTGRNALQQVATERLLELRESHKRQLEGLFGEFTNSLEVYSSGFSAVQAIEAFTDGFNQLSNATISPAQQESIVNYYSNAVVKPISQLTGDDVDINALLPTSNSQKYLQANYTPQCASATESVSCSDAGDGSTWSAANARYNDFFRGIVTRFDYRDALLLDLHGNVVYTVSKGPDLGTNIFTGPYRETVLRDAYRKALRSNNVNFVWITDFQQYQPQLDAPTAWVVSPIGMAGKIEGVMALPLPISKINDIMNAHKHWEAVGMGRSTETYLVGPDNLMRSDSRLFLQDRDKYQREAIAGGTPRDVVDSAIRLGTTVLVQPVPSAGVRYAERGQTGVTKDTDYLGNRELQAYAPVDVPNSDLHWSILATRDDWDAYQRLSTFGKTLVLAVAGITLAICVVSMLLAKLLVRPIRRLEAGTERISAGDYEVTVPVRSRDELGDLTAAFNEMSRNLKIKEELLNEQRKENDRLLLSLMPAPVVQRYREGVQTVAQEHQDVAVIFADMVGLDDMSDDLSGDELVAVVNELFRQFDSAAEALGVERIRTFHNGYLASCGATTPRLDNIHRSVDFAIEIQRIIDRFNSRSRHKLRLRVGVNTGKVISGLVGRASLAYDMWGAAVSLAYQMHSGSPQPGIYVTSQVYEAMRDIWKFVPAGTISVGGSEQQIWRLVERQ
ncbi:adenylate/guanylate cyclase domain-containing protein [Mycobacterium kansasii]|nr:adenylate/guanylate cyclase domain-containing protein [Mycobacterium kansasii]UCA22375.1 HAMP domain-containing protein [Mycobacterium kansasii]UGT84063.1 HAMP domain-containing protein [Mycobacterium kansasii]UGT89322.1 HAMP domain-containing protein [Mycobacterium kansasii]UGU27778.1 HAMP domain-containing protein [Mycobacterium kansasii]